VGRPTDEGSRHSGTGAVKAVFCLVPGPRPGQPCGFPGRGIRDRAPTSLQDHPHPWLPVSETPSHHRPYDPPLKQDESDTRASGDVGAAEGWFPPTLLTLPARGTSPS
jgi:hypothetical protein